MLKFDPSRGPGTYRRRTSPQTAAVLDSTGRPNERSGRWVRTTANPEKPGLSALPPASYKIGRSFETAVPICRASCQAIALESNCEAESVELLMFDRVFGLSAMLSLSWAAHAEDCGQLTRLKLDHVVITSAEAVPA